MSLKSVGPLNYTLNRNFTNLTYDDVRQVINYTMDYDYEMTNAKSAELVKTNI